MSLPASENIEFVKSRFFRVGEIASLIFLMNLRNMHSRRACPHACPHGAYSRFYMRAGER